MNESATHILKTGVKKKTRNKRKQEKRKTLHYGILLSFVLRANKTENLQVSRGRFQFITIIEVSSESQTKQTVPELRNDGVCLGDGAARGRR